MVQKHLCLMNFTVSVGPFVPSLYLGPSMTYEWSTVRHMIIWSTVRHLIYSYSDESSPNIKSYLLVIIVGLILEVNTSRM